MDRLAALYTLDPVIIAIAVGVLVGLLLLATGVVVLLILQHSAREAEIAQLRARAETALERARLAEAGRTHAEARLGRIRRAGPGEGGFWTREPHLPPRDLAARMARGVPVVALVNLQGGVGKTALAAALLGHLDARGERVLAVDLDRLATLSDRLSGELAAPGPRGGGDGACAGALLSGAGGAPRAVPGAASGSALIGAGCDLASRETRLVLDWVIGEGEDDPRYRLARHLLGPRVADRFDRVILDTPPRMSLGWINAVAAATHLLVPVRMNAGSVAALARFLDALDALRPLPLAARRQPRILPVRCTPGPVPAGWETAAASGIDALLAERGAPGTGGVPPLAWHPGADGAAGLTADDPAIAAVAAAIGAGRAAPVPVRQG